MTRNVGILAVVLCVTLLLAAAGHGATRWIEVRSRHFRVVGETSEGIVREAARRLEEFREALFQLLPGRRTDALTIAVLFADDSSFRPFGFERNGVRREVRAYFVEAPDDGYVVVRLTGPGDFHPHLLHEFTHAYTATSFPNAPAWFSEGLAEYFSTCKVSDDGTRATVGEAVVTHPKILRRQWLPLHSVLGASKDSPLYLTARWAGPFYAESWALVHYLLQNSVRRAQLQAFLANWDPTTPYQQDFQSAFGCSIDQMEARLQEYVRGGEFTSHVTVLPHSVMDMTATVAEQLGDAAVEARLGDLLAHLGRVDEAEQRLQNALRLAPRLADVHQALGRMRLMQDKELEGLQYLRQAASLAKEDFDVQADYGRVLLRRTATISPEQLAEARTAFERALALRPNSPEALSGAARACLAAGERLDEAQKYAERAAQTDPSNPEHQLLLADIEARRGNATGAQRRLGSLTASSAPGIAERARMMAKRVAANDGPSETTGTGSPSRGGEAVAIGPTRFVYLRRMNPDEQRVFGILERIECDPGTRVMTLAVRSGERVVRFAVPPKGVTFISYREDVKATLDCGARDPGERVLVTWRPTAAGDEKTVPAGQLVAVEWVPRNYLPDERVFEKQ